MIEFQAKLSLSVEEIAVLDRAVMQAIEMSQRRLDEAESLQVVDAVAVWKDALGRYTHVLQVLRSAAWGGPRDRS